MYVRPDGAGGRQLSPRIPTPKISNFSMKWILKGCPACGAALYSDPMDDGWFTCMLCARNFQLKEVRQARRPAPLRLSPPIPDSGDPADIDWDT